ncbi:MAG: hypothetical protein ACNYPD_06645 [Candidatus Halichondribacter symbioticus]
MTYIKTLTAPLIIIAGLALLTACGGGATPDEDPTETPAVNCAETPFDSPDMCAEEQNIACLAHGTDVEAGGHATCADRPNVITTCTTDPYSHDGCDTATGINVLRTTFCRMPANLFNAMCISRGLGDNERDTFCALPANIFAHTECMDLGNINDLRNTYCTDSGRLFNQMCIDGKHRDDLRTAFCEMPANIFTHAECMDLDNINDIRMTFCSKTDIFHETCLDNTYGGDGERDTECRTHGITEPMGDASCDGRIRVACTGNPFVYDGCDTLDTDDETIRDDFCKMPANIFAHAKCINIKNINDLRNTYCSATEIFHESCLNDDYDGGNKRDDACQTHGTNVGAGGHASCDGRIRTACMMNPFEYLGCDTLDADKDDNIRTKFCAKPAQLFNPTCITRKIGDHDDDRDTACLTSPAGVPEHPSCANRPGVIQTCTTDPFLVTNPANTGCENLATIVSIREVHCGTSANFAGRCTVDYDDWKDSFDTAPPTRPNTTTGAQKNEFLNAGEGALADAVTAFFEIAEASQVVESDTLNFDGTIGDPTANSVSYFSADHKTDSSIRYYYAGLDSRADLGAPSFQKTGTATWVGKFQVLLGENTLAVQDFELTVNFETKSVTSLVQQGSTNNYFYLKGDYDSNGVIDGTVNYTKLSAAITASDRTTIMNDATPEGILTGLIGKQGAIGAFLSGTGDKDDITGGTSATDGFAGGFVANPFDGNVSYRDWASSGQIPAATANTANLQNELLQTTRNDLNIGTITGTAVHLNLATATYEDVALGGSATNGFTTFASTANNYYAGITSTTNLGKALERTTGTGAWKGSFVAYEGGAATTTDFELMVEFAATSKVSATIGEYAFSSTDVASNGTFTTGITLTRLNITNGSGTVSGIIGQKGAVGVFRSDSNADVSYAGGFVAVSHAFDGRVNYADWVEVTTPDTTRATPLANQFLTGADGITTTTNGTVSFLTFANATHGGTSFAGDGNDGFQVYSNDRSTGTNPTNFYAGILTTTNLGAPLTQTTAEGTWQGRLYAVRDTVIVNAETLVNAEVADFTPTVNFGTKTISATITGVTRFRGVAIVADTVSYDFTAIWDERGVFQSTINRTLSSVASTGVLTGLIGAEGAVGVFVSDADEPVGYAGGFVARKAP